jgi:hypothetical protein
MINREIFQFNEVVVVIVKIHENDHTWINYGAHFIILYLVAQIVLQYILPICAWGGQHEYEHQTLKSTNNVRFDLLLFFVDNCFFFNV